MNFDELFESIDKLIDEHLDEIFDDLNDFDEHDDLENFNELETILNRYVEIDNHTLEEKLSAVSITLDQAIEELCFLRKKAIDISNSYHLDITNKATLIIQMTELTEYYADDTFVWLYTLVVCENGIVMGENFHMRTPKEKAHLFLDVIKSMDKLQLLMEKQKKYKKIFQNLITNLQKEHLLIKENTLDKYGIFNIYTQWSQSKNSGEILLTNIEMLLEHICASKSLICIAPLFLYQIFIKHHKRICNTIDFNFNMNKLWEYTEYKIHENNGKNFDAFHRNMELFISLCRYFHTVDGCDLQLSMHGFLSLSNITHWCFAYDYTEKSKDFPIPITKFVKRNFDTCFENGYTDAVLFSENHFELAKINCYLQPENSKYRKVSERIQEYMTDHPFSLAKHFAEERYAPHKLITYILEKSEVSTKYFQLEDLPIFFAGINIQLLQLTDEVCIDILGKIGEQILNMQ